MSCRLVEGQLHEFQTLELTNNYIALTIIPQLGAKIASLRHLSAQREWLWKNPRQAYSAPNFDSSYVESFDLGGIDECFPAVAAGAYPTAPWTGTIIADHGELWSQPWRLQSLDVTDQQIHLTQTCYGLRFPYRFERTLRLVGDRAAVEFTYHVTNLSPYPFPFIWSIHPILAIEPGMRLALPAQVDQVRINSATDASYTLHYWPIIDAGAGERVDASHVPDRTVRRAVKLVTPPLAGENDVTASITTADGDHTLRVHFSPQEISHFALWMNYGGWAGDGGTPYFNLGFEPCIGATDTLETCVHSVEEPAALAPHECRKWQLTIECT